MKRYTGWGLSVILVVLVAGPARARLAQADSALSATLPAQGLEVQFASAVHIDASDGAFAVSLALQKVGRAGALTPVEACEPRLVGSRVEYLRGPVCEWYVFDERGLEQGFTLAERPEGEGPLRLEIALETDLEPVVSAGGRGLELHDEAGHAALHYAGLFAFDAQGHELEARLRCDAQRLVIEVEDRDARYPLVVDPWIVTELAKVTGSDLTDFSNFGSATSLDGDRAVVGAPLDDGFGSSSGAAYLYERNEGGFNAWGEVTRLVPDDASIGDWFGDSTAVSGDWAFVSAPYSNIIAPLGEGAVYVFERDQGGSAAWGQTAQLTARQPDSSDNFGYDLSADGNRFVVGALTDDRDEVVFLHGLALDSVTGTLYGADSFLDQLVRVDRVTGWCEVIGPFGFSRVEALAFDELTATLYGVDTISDQLLTIDPGTGQGTAVGVIGFGRVRGLAFDPIGGCLYGSDTPTDQLIKIDPATGAGTAVGPLGYPNVRGLTYDTAGARLVGADGVAEELIEVELGTGAGTSIGDVGTDLFALADRGDGSLLGTDKTDLLAVDSGTGSASALGSFLTPSLSGCGAAYVFEADWLGPNSWGEVRKLRASDAAAGDHFGSAVAIDDDTLVIGAQDRDEGAEGNQGRAYVFERNASGTNTWGEVRQLAPADGGANKHFGAAVAVHADTILVGAGWDDEGGVNKGSAYVYERDAGGSGNWGEVAKLTASDGEAGDTFGAAVAIAGELLLIGAPRDDNRNGDIAGAIYVFQRVGSGAWIEIAKLIASDGVAGDSFGSDLALGPGAAIVGAPLAATPTTDGGAAYFFDLSLTTGNYCTAGQSASGCLASISATGTPSATASSGFQLGTTGAEGAKDGLFFFGTAGRQANQWGNGTSFQCVVPPVIRAGLLQGSGTPGACDGTFAQDLNALWCPTCPKPGKNPGAGSIVRAQLWYRDPLNTSNQTTSLSDAVEFTVQP